MGEKIENKNREWAFSGWALFCDEAAAFSDTFREEMATQLLKKFYLMLGITTEIKIHKVKFRLMVGGTPLKTIYKDGYAFAMVEIINPISLSKAVTAYWKPKNGELSENAVHINVWNSENIEFGWCVDFDKNDYIRYLKPENRLDKKQFDIPFDIEYDFSLYPDLVLTICFNQKVFKNEIEQIENILSEEIKKAYISELTNENQTKESNEDNEIFGMFDFHNDDFTEATQQIIDSFIKIGKSNIGNKINKIVIQ
ncbi:MAG: hypothetical protein FWH36_04725 [Lentimicrobiaceae bacterium]|nr:hypothetical protein [Lentimicrobiaceae bacterium]